MGLYTALAPMAIYAVFGSARRLQYEHDRRTIGMLTGAALTELAHQSAPEQMIAAALTLSLIVGAVLLLGSFVTWHRQRTSFPTPSSRASRSAWASS